MSGIIEKQISGVDYEFWIRTGTVSSIVPKSDGGVVDLDQGGLVVAVVAEPGSKKWKDLRVDGDDGEAYSASVHESVGAAVGDRVSLIFAKARLAETASVHGLKNHMDDRWWSFGCQKLVKPEHKRSIEALAFRFASKGVLSFAAAMAVLTAVLSAARTPELLSDPMALFSTLHFAFAANWVEVFGWTLFAAVATRIAYAGEVKSAARRASEAILGMTMHTKDSARVGAVSAAA